MISGRERPSISWHIDAQDFPWLAFDPHLKRSAADFAIGDEPLRGHTRVNHQVKALPAEWTLDGFRNLHVDMTVWQPLKFKL
jgi:hypothetical protein